MWFIKNLTRLNIERAAIADLTKEVDWLIRADWDFCGAKLCLIVDIEAHGHLYPVRMVYPECYPASPPTVTPRETKDRWSAHQYGPGGELCLEWGPDNWHESVTGADVLRSAYKLLEIENPRSEKTSRAIAPSRHVLAMGQKLRNASYRFVSNGSLRSYVESLDDEITGIATIFIFLSRKDITAFVKSIEPTGGPKWGNSSLPPEMKNEAALFKVPFIKSNQDTFTADSLAERTVMEILEKHGTDISHFEDSSPHFVLVGDFSGEVRLHWADKWIPFKVLDTEEQNQEKRLPSQYKVLKSKVVGIVGLGSAGSKIAVSLARSGVRKFILIDHDVFLPDNFCRHELNWEDVGQHKVEGVANRIKLIASGTEVTVRKLMLSGQEATASIDSALSQLAGCNLIVDATANPSVFNQLSAVVCQSDTSMVWLEIFAGGIGGVIAIYRPGKDPDPKTMRASLNQYLSERETPDIRTTSNYSAIDREGQPVIASDADVSVIAASATRMALDVLLGNEPSLFPASLYLIGLSSAWIFEQPFFTIPFDFSGMRALPSDAEQTKEEIKEAMSFLCGLLEKKKNEDTSST